MLRLMVQNSANNKSVPKNSINYLLVLILIPNIFINKYDIKKQHEIVISIFNFEPQYL